MGSVAHRNCSSTVVCVKEIEVGAKSTKQYRYNYRLRPRRLLTGLVAHFVLLLPCPGASPEFQQQSLFQGQHGGYELYRIPGIVVTARGTILAYAEARKYTGGDWDTIDLVMRRSTDGGRTFQPPAVVAETPAARIRNPVALARKQGDPSDVTYNNPVAIAAKDGTVYLLFCTQYMRVFEARSEDDGAKFSAPVEITGALESLRRKYPWRVVATGPGHGIELENGRLIASVWLALGTSGNGHSPSQTTTIYSDDKGKTWHAGEIAAPDTSTFPSPNEAEAVELANHRVMLNVRTTSSRHRRLIVTSKNGASQWSKPQFDTELMDPICFASIQRLSLKRGESENSPKARNRLLFVNPDPGSGRERRNLTARVSYDEGEHWNMKQVIDPGPAGYADLAVGPDGTIFCFYEKRDLNQKGHRSQILTLATFNLEWLTNGNDSMESKMKAGTIR